MSDATPSATTGSIDGRCTASLGCIETCATDANTEVPT